MVDITTRLLLDTEIQVDGVKAGIIYITLINTKTTIHAMKNLPFCNICQKGSMDLTTAKNKNKTCISF